MSFGPLAWAVATEMCVGKNRSLIMGIGTAGFWIVAFVVYVLSIWQSKS